MPDPGQVARPWLDAYPPGVPATWRWPDVALPRLLEDAARDFPDVDAIRLHGRNVAAVTWAEVDTMASRVAAGLAARGVGAGDRVALAVGNGPAAAIAAFGAWRAGAVLVLLEPGLPASVREEALRATLPRVTIVDEDATEGGHGHASDELDWTGAGELVVTSPADWRVPGRARRLRARLRRRHDQPPPAAGGWSALADPGQPVPAGTIDPDSPAVLSPSGSATGHRRIVTLTHRQLVAAALQARLWVPDVQAGREVVLAAVPFADPYGLVVGLLASALSAATLVVPASTDPVALATCAAEEHPTLFPATPLLVESLMLGDDRTRRRDRGQALASLRVCLVAGGPLAPDLVGRLRLHSGEARVREVHAHAEAGGLTHAHPIYGRSQRGPGGLPVTGTTAVVVSEDDPTRVLPVGQTGLLAVAGPQVMAGYWHDPEATSAVLRDGWLLTGDLVVQDATGSFLVVDRVVDVATTPAGDAYPGDVEAVLARHPGVRTALASTRPTTLGGDEIVVAVELSAPVTAQELTAWCGERLPTHAVPARFDIVESLAFPPAGTLRPRSRPGRTGKEVAG